MNEQRRDFLKNSSLGLASIALGAGFIAQNAFADNQAQTANAAELPEIEAELTYAPNVPKPIERDYPARVVVKLTASEQIMELMPDVQFKFWIFNNGVPAPFIRVRQDDIVELQLSNSISSMMAHSVDFHAASAPMGAADGNTTNPGKTTISRFKAVHPGIYLYHCGTDPVAIHLAKGMYGLILVEPKGGLPKVDREYYIMQSEFYTKGEFGDPGLQPFSMRKAIDERADYVLFNGKVDSLTEGNALKAKVGETVRLFVGNAGPNLCSSFHLIGGVFDTVYMEGGSLTNHNVQTTLIPSGSATIVESKLLAPGIYPFLDHSIFRAANKGTIGHLIVEGAENPEVYAGKVGEQDFKEDNPKQNKPVPYEIDAHQHMNMEHHHK